MIVELQPLEIVSQSDGYTYSVKRLIFDTNRLLLKHPCLSNGLQRFSLTFALSRRC